jgi:hypothetical protein
MTVPVSMEEKRLTGGQTPFFEQTAEWETSLPLLYAAGVEYNGIVGRRDDGINAGAPQIDVVGISFDADPMAVEILGDDAGRT